MANFYLKENGQVISNARNLTGKPRTNLQLRKIDTALVDLGEWMSSIPFDGLEESIALAQDAIDDYEYFNGSLLKNLIDEMDKDLSFHAE